MSIAVLTHLHHPIVEPFQGGLEAHTAQLCAALARRGHQVTLFAKEGTVSPAPGVDVIGVMPADFVWRDGESAENDRALEEATELACRLAQGHDAVVNSTLNPVPYWALPESAMVTVLHTPATLERVTALVQSGTWRPGLLHRWASVSHANAISWRELLPVPVEVVHNGINLDAWTYGAKPGGPLVWSARITPEKGLHIAMDAAAQAGLPLRIAGPVSDRTYFDQEIRPRLHAQPDARYLGHLDHYHLPNLLARSSAFLCTPLWDEPFGLAPLEAMACGTPVAGLRRGAVPELLGTDGGVVADSPAELPDAVLAARGLDRAKVRARAGLFGEDEMVDGYLRILAPLLDKGVDAPLRGEVLQRLDYGQDVRARGEAQ